MNDEIYIRRYETNQSIGTLRDELLKDDFDKKVKAETLEKVGGTSFLFSFTFHRKRGLSSFSKLKGRAISTSDDKTVIEIMEEKRASLAETIFIMYVVNIIIMNFMAYLKGRLSGRNLWIALFIGAAIMGIFAALVFWLDGAVCKAERLANLKEFEETFALNFLKEE